MNLNKNDMALQIASLPQRFHSLGNVSMFSLLEATGYLGLHEQISETDIRKALVSCPECVQEWMQYSEDQRSSSAWYFTLNDEGLYETGHFDIKSVPNDTNRVQYENAIDACAAFIKHVIESIRQG
jgi:hypothetical protein